MAESLVIRARRLARFAARIALRLAPAAGPGMALLLACAPARASEPGAVFLDGGWRAAFLDRQHRMGTGCGLGLAYGADESTELSLRFDYSFIPSRPDASARGAMEMKAWELASYFAPYRGDFRPMIGMHAGMVRARADGLRWSLGMDAVALYDFRDQIQIYGALTPSLLVGGGSGDGTGDIWVRLGLGVRKRIGR